MIEAKDLRIGNYITDIWASEGSMFKVVLLSDNYPHVKYGAKFSTNIKNLRGVPLTECMLIKAGFKRSSDIGNSSSFFFIPVGGSEFHINPENGVVWIERDDYVFNNPALIEHLHSLQNIYWCLSGQELDIKLQ